MVMIYAGFRGLMYTEWDVSHTPNPFALALTPMPKEDSTQEP